MQRHFWCPNCKIHFYTRSLCSSFQRKIYGRGYGHEHECLWKQNNATVIDWSGGNSVDVTILPSDFKSPKISGATAGLELALKKFSFGIISLYGNYQAVYAEDTDENFEFCQGVACGTRLYLSKIAFPAFALGVSRNFSTGDFFWSVSLGASF